MPSSRRVILVVALALATLAAWRIVRMAIVPAPAASVEALLNDPVPGRTAPRNDRGLPHPPDKSAVARARSSLESEPLSAPAFEVLALAAEHEGDEVKAARLMRIAAALWPRELRAQTWLLAWSLRHGDRRSAMSRLDTIVRARPDTLDALTEALAPAFQDPATDTALVDLLADAPWRTRFIDIAVRQWREPAGLIGLIDRLQAKPGGLNAAELRPFLTKLMATGQFDQAYLAWLRSLPSDRPGNLAYLYNGHFRYPVTDMPFDWQMPTVPGAVVSVTGAAEQRVLAVGFLGARVSSPPILHDLVLAPGDYRLSGRVRTDRVRTERGLRWTLACLDNGPSVQASSELLLGTTAWRDFTMDFKVPETGCQAQTLGLDVYASTGAEQWVSGVVSFSQLDIRPQ